MKIEKPSNPKAFPNDWNIDDGMTLRDYFANSAMQGLLSSYVGSSDVYNDIKNGADEMAKTSYRLADAMLKQREL